MKKSIVDPLGSRSSCVGTQTSLEEGERIGVARLPVKPVVSCADFDSRHKDTKGTHKILFFSFTPPRESCMLLWLRFLFF